MYQQPQPMGGQPMVGQPMQVSQPYGNPGYGPDPNYGNAGYAPQPYMTNTVQMAPPPPAQYDQYHNPMTQAPNCFGVTYPIPMT
eukprot:CAMPEP_0197016626 /NCGR_PEP_ID=MMETSP1380-20130617/79074_1 /TAXON_ID=5936 /ORGANISM="Euplotes crassus, Strain CT5" /LENGTH=83 /DNA_ID=CAMNT_0042443599 /DNA_START=31 /DNA_END=282 /DNA_ORIENTATION=-